MSLPILRRAPIAIQQCTQSMNRRIHMFDYPMSRNAVISHPSHCLKFCRRYANKVESSSKASDIPDLSVREASISDSSPLKEKAPTELRENPYTIPNFLTVSRIVCCPILAWSIMTSQAPLTICLLTYAGLSDAVDGYLARHYGMGTVVGSILDPAADKLLVTTLVGSLWYSGLLASGFLSCLPGI